ncbi:MAG: pyridine nucleotide-disulfide oxidoreductase [Thiotrichales bacterium]|nr:pyridine nucleotide-disulfide oxidoreductase [Thiotrichales bacterium]
MNNRIGTPELPLTVAIVGAGPSGFYAIEALLKSELTVRLNLFERLPSPYGLVRSGVAPDHPKLKQAIQVYNKIADTDALTFIGNVTVGKDISIEELQQYHHAIIFSCGAETDRRLGIPGEDLTGSYTATEFVGWYNGHPDYRDREFDLSHDTAVIIGQGNVAADVSRILSKTVDELKHTDIAEHALDALAESKIRNIYVIGRRGPAQAKFTSKELREFGDLNDCDPIVDPAELKLNPASQEELAEKTNAGSKKIYDMFMDYSQRETGSKARRCLFQFLRSPVELIGDEHLQRVKLEFNELSGDAFKQSARGTGKTYELDAGILFRSIGYRGVPIEGVPFDERAGVFPNTNGRITSNGKVLPGMYTAGWIKRGPTGIIGTNRACSVGTVTCLVEDLDRLGTVDINTDSHSLQALLSDRKLRTVNFQEWQKIDAVEVERGEPKGKPREKFTRVNEMLEIIS